MTTQEEHSEAELRRQQIEAEMNARRRQIDRLYSLIPPLTLEFPERNLALSPALERVKVLRKLFNPDFKLRLNTGHRYTHLIDFVTLEVIEGLDDALQRLEALVKAPQDKELSEAINEIDGILNRMVDGILTNIKRSPSDLQEAVQDSLSTVSSRIEIIQTIEQARTARRGAEEAQREAGVAAVEAQESAIHVKEVAGEEAAGELAEHFAQLARGEKRAADQWRLVAVSVLLATSAAASWLLHGLTNASMGDIVRRALVTLPLAVLAGYAIHESSQHRLVTRWAETIAVQLRTVKAFTDPLSQDVRDSIRTQFGVAIFSVWPSMSDSRSRRSNSNPTPLADISPLLHRALELTRNHQK